MENQEFEHSALSGPVSHGGETVDVEIYRRAGSQTPWRMDIVHMRGGCTRWAQRFATERDAYEAFQALVVEHGRTIFSGRSSAPRH